MSDSNSDYSDPAAQDAPVLDQNEIDALLSFAGEQHGAGRPGMQKVLNSGLIAYERLPMLEIVFDRLVRIMTTRAGCNRFESPRLPGSGLI